MRYHYKSQLDARRRRHLRVRAKVSGTATRPRLNVYRSSAHIYAQLIDDTTSTTLASASDLEPGFASQLSDGTTKRDKAQADGKLIGERANDNGNSTVDLDRED